MANIDYFFATISPYTYMAGLRLEEIAAKHGATITYKPLDIMGMFSRTGGQPPKDRHISRQEYRLLDMERSAKKQGMSINMKPMHFPTNPAPSSYAIIAAQKVGGDIGGLVHSFTRAVWAEERDIAQDVTIRDVLSGAGFDPTLADADMLGSAEEYAANLEEAVSRGVFGSPFYMLGDHRFWGQDRLEDLDLTLAGKL